MPQGKSSFLKQQLRVPELFSAILCNILSPSHFLIVGHQKNLQQNYRYPQQSVYLPRALNNICSSVKPF